MNRTATSVVRLRRMTAKGCSVRCDIWRRFHDYPLPRRKAQIYRVRGSPFIGSSVSKGRPRNAASFDSDSVSLDIHLAPANELLASGRKSHFALGRHHCEGEFGAAPLSSEIGLTRDAGCRAPRPIGRAPTPDPQQPPDLLGATARSSEVSPPDRS